MRNKPVKRSRSKDQQERSKLWMYLLLGAAAFGLIALGYLLYLGIQEPEALAGIQRFVGLSRGHDETEDYSALDLPPSGGLHSGIWQNCGIYEQPVEANNVVHSMEHGAVWITYSPGLLEKDIETLQDHVRGETHLLLSPFPGLRSPVVLTAWGVQLEVESADDDRIADFIDQYQRGPQNPEVGATCSNGLGTPINPEP
ncbi:MAG: DUF3105 domain-containing protein [Anaerolineae bacterium]|nr:MAG: DUF3105 domain-containing protein [Anaerolineae bacterium]